MKKSRYNPSGKPVLTKGKKAKGSHIKMMDYYTKRLSKFRKR